MYLGTGKAIITPPIGAFLAGYGHRDHGSEAILDDLELRVFWLQGKDDPAEAICIITADLIGFDNALTDAIRSEISENTGIRPDAVLLAASHTHSGPQTCARLSSAGGDPDPDYIATLRRKLLETVASARQDLKPIAMRAAKGHLEGYAINRRLMVHGEMLMAPNPEGRRDDEVIALSFHDPDNNQVKAVLFHFTCHPTVMGDYRITGDYPAAARRYVEKTLAGGAAGFLPGCFGDVRPACTLVGGKRFRRGMPEDVAEFGSALGAEVVRLVHERTATLHPKLFAGTATIELPLQQEPEKVSLSLQRLDLAEEVSLIALGGEICVDYGHFIKRLNPDRFMVPVGYSNGMVGYVPSARMFPEGGYEPVTSHTAFDLPSPFQPAIEEMIQETIRDIVH